MLRNDVTADRLRQLAETRTAGRTVISVVLNLDPREFATGAARATAITSLLDDASRRIRDIGDLAHDEQKGLRASLERLRTWFAGEFSAQGAHALVVVVSAPDDLLEVVRLPRPADSCVAIGDAPALGALVHAGVRERWAVVLLNRTGGRLLRGTADGLVAVGSLEERVGDHDEHDAREHVEHVVAALARSDAEDPYDRLLVGASDELHALLEHDLGDRARERLAGRLHVDQRSATDDDVLAAARPLMEQDAGACERALLDRLAAGLGTGERAAAGFAAVGEALEQSRVQTLLVGERTEVPDDVLRAALLQSAAVVGVRFHDDLDAHGGIAALLRF